MYKVQIESKTEEENYTGRKIIIVIPIPFSIWLNYIGDSRSDEIWKWKKIKLKRIENYNDSNENNKMLFFYFHLEKMPTKSFRD